MLEWIEANIGSIGTISAVVTGICGTIAAFATMLKSIQIGKLNKTQYDKLKSEVEITKTGIVEAFKTVKFPTEWKIDLSKKVDAKFDELSDRLYTKIVQNDEIKTRLMIYMAKIMSNTAAYNKLTDEEKAELNSLLTQINELEIS